MPKKKVTSRFRGTDIFSRRLVISIPRSGILVIVIAIIAGLIIPMVYETILLITSTCFTLIALAVIIEARFQLRNFRYEIREQVTALRRQWIVPEDLEDLREYIDGMPEDEDLYSNVETDHIWLPKSRRR